MHTVVLLIGPTSSLVGFCRLSEVEIQLPKILCCDCSGFKDGVRDKVSKITLSPIEQ